MANSTLSEEYLPAFMYLVDLIVAEEAQVDYDTIAVEGVEERQDIDARTIKRAFELREALRKEALTGKVYRPSFKTLNALTFYYFEGKEKLFAEFARKHSKNIEEHFYRHRPSDAVVSTLFESSQNKIQRLKTQKTELEKLLQELDGKSLGEFLGELVDDRLASFYKRSEAEGLKTELESYIDQQIKRVIQKEKRASILFRFFGSFGLLLVGVDQIQDMKRRILEDFTEEQEALLDDDDELLDMI
ncbi:hypothetical protein [Poritiphilus flavus]|uniref:Uncharacterized protein n=1 Tax=Poritiphilus flavus TaxID=2697053 RepID=A0A6L9EHX3_9FLAO|nr:hypothetical protein [Poritiphilus flavus]NAS14331.1 hypothetical protein [Poritiphilus flavus]